MTLIELVISLLILTILSTAFYVLFFSGERFWNSETAHSTLRQNLQVLDDRVALEMRDSDISTITNNTTGSPAAFSFLSADDRSGSFVTSSSGQPVWQKYVIYCIPSGTTKLFRSEVYGSFTAAMGLSQLIADCNGTGKLISPSVSSMVLTLNSANHSADLSATLSSTNNNGNAEKEARDITIWMRD